MRSGKKDDSEGYFAALVSAEVNGKTEYFLTRKGSDMTIRRSKESLKDVDDFINIATGSKVNEVKSDEAFLKRVAEVLPKGEKYYDVGHLFKTAIPSPAKSTNIPVITIYTKQRYMIWFISANGVFCF